VPFLLFAFPLAVSDRDELNMTTPPMGEPVDSFAEFGNDLVPLDIEFPAMIVCFVANSCEANTVMQMVAGKYVIVRLKIIDPE
jgi:hypothetical protein